MADSKDRRAIQLGPHGRKTMAAMMPWLKYHFPFQGSKMLQGLVPRMAESQVSPLFCESWPSRTSFAPGRHWLPGGSKAHKMIESI